MPRLPLPLVLALLLVAGTHCSGAHAASSLHPTHPSRRALRASDAIATQDITFINTCEDAGVSLRLRFRFDGAYDWFGRETTDVIPRPFVDYFCDNIGQVDFQMEGSKADDPAIQAAIASGLCINDQVQLRWPGWKGRGPQSSLDLQVPNGTVWDMFVSINEEAGVTPVTLASYDEVVYRTLDGFRDCRQGQQGCAKWWAVSVDQSIEFVCGEE